MWSWQLADQDDADLPHCNDRYQSVPRNQQIPFESSVSTWAACTCFACLFVDKIKRVIPTAFDLGRQVGEMLCFSRVIRRLSVRLAFKLPPLILGDDGPPHVQSSLPYSTKFLHGDP